MTLEKIKYGPEYYRIREIIEYYACKEGEEMSNVFDELKRKQEHQIEDDIFEYSIYYLLGKSGIEFKTEKRLRVELKEEGVTTPDFLLLGDYNGTIIDCKNIALDGIISASTSSNHTDAAKYDTKILDPFLDKINKLYKPPSGYHIRIKKLAPESNKFKDVIDHINSSKSNELYQDLIKYLKIQIELQLEETQIITYKTDVLQIDFRVTKSKSETSGSICGPARSGCTGKLDERIIKEVEKKHKKYSEKTLGNQKIERIIVVVSVDYGISVSDLKQRMIDDVFRDRNDLVAVVISYSKLEVLNQRGLLVKEIFVNPNITLEDSQNRVLDLFEKCGYDGVKLKAN
jgi:hypothetical protein